MLHFRRKGALRTLHERGPSPHLRANNKKEIRRKHTAQTHIGRGEERRVVWTVKRRLG